MNLTTYKLVEVDVVKKTATLKTRATAKGRWTNIAVTLSNLLLYRIKEGMKDARKMQYDEVEFTSTVNSIDFDKNPLKLVRFEQRDGKLKNYHVRLVHEAGFKVEFIKDLFGRRAKKFIDYYHSPKYFIRYEVVILKQ